MYFFIFWTDDSLLLIIYFSHTAAVIAKIEASGQSMLLAVQTRAMLFDNESVLDVG